MGGVKKLAEAADTDPNYLSSLASEKPPKIPSGKRRGVGDEIARKLEKAAGKPPGWMDHLHEWGAAATMWMDRFAKLPEDRQNEAIEFLEFLLRKEGIDPSQENNGADDQENKPE